MEKYRNEKELKRFDPKRDFLRSNRNDLLSKYIIINSISFLAGLFDIEIKLKAMPIQVDIRKTFLFKWGKEEVCIWRYLVK